MIKIIKKEKYNKLIGELEAIKKNYNHRDNIAKILEKNLSKANAEICKYKIDIEDLEGFLAQEKQCSKALRKQVKSLKALLTRNKIDYSHLYDIKKEK